MEYSKGLAGTHIWDKHGGETGTGLMTGPINVVISQEKHKPWEHPMWDLRNSHLHIEVFESICCACSLLCSPLHNSLAPTLSIPPLLVPCS